MKLNDLMETENFGKFFEYMVFGSILNLQDELVSELQDEEITNLWEQLQDQVHNKHRDLRIKIEKELEKEEWYRSKISAIADIVEEIRKDSKKLSFNRIMTDVETWEASRIKE